MLPDPLHTPLHSALHPMSLPEAIALGALHGATELLPVSCDGHAALARMLFGVEAGRAFDAAARCGALAATVLVLRRRTLCALEEGLRGLVRPSLWRETPGGRDALTILIATVPTAAIAIALSHSAEAWSSSPAVIGGGLLLSAAAVASTSIVRVVGPVRRNESDGPAMIGAIVVGAAQGAAVLPGLSRSAVTVAALLWLGVRAERAFELAFLIAIPMLGGAALLEGGALSARGVALSSADAAALVAGGVASFVVGLVALSAMRRIVIGGKLALVAFYLVPLAIATLAWGYARP